MKTGKVIPILQLILALGIAGFWVLYFFEQSCQVPLQSCAQNPTADCLPKLIQCERYRGFENSFPVPDLLLLTPLLIVGAIGLWRDRRYGVIASLMAGTALIFLGLLDVSFNIPNGRYAIDVVEGTMNVLINGVCLIFGLLLVWRMALRL